MSKIINEPITVHINNDLELTAFIWRRRFYKIIETLARWHEPSAWWNGEPIRILLRVTASNRAIGIYELCKLSKNWFLTRLLD